MVRVLGARRGRCRGCNCLRYLRARHLCKRCYHKSGYAESHGYHMDAPLPAEATNAVPGSELKIQVLIARRERREQLNHPDDRRCRPARVRTFKVWLERGER